MELTISDEKFKQHLSEAILLSIGDTGREAIIADAIERLTLPTIVKDRYGHDTKEAGPSKIQDLFTTAVHMIARETIHKLISEDEEISARLNDLLRESLLAMLTSPDTNIGQAMAHAFTAALTKADRY